jgi:septum formation protein
VAITPEVAVTEARAAIVLASGSPRRRELLAVLGVPFVVRATNVDETPRNLEVPEALVLRLALLKARRAAGDGETALGADTEVAVDDRPLGKPGDAAAARAMLAALSGRTHEVWTGLAIVDRRAGRVRETARAVRTEVRFRPLTGEEIDRYVATGEPLDRAGAYAIQGGAGRFVQALEGSWTNVVGLPLEELAALLAELGLRTPGPYPDPPTTALEGDGIG